MPKDSHTKQLAAEREAMETYGLTRGQARAGLWEAAKLQQAEKNRRELELEALTKRIEAKVAAAAGAAAAVEQKFKPRPFMQGGENAVAQLAVPAAPYREVLVISPTDFINYFGTPSPTETSTAVPWPDGTACAVDTGNQDPNIGFLGYRVFSGNLYLRWTCFTGSGRSLGGDITITAFL